ncbi:plasmid partitioning protein RepB [Tropicimonas sp. IMCC34043]|uniref:plasmid partitioning protein RepB n=1 Tax=Tropicimonas sp. IMCC34043 TaxID=2248760 RepID=UPI000E221CF5|nr:plasmid partitioning protein RepB [Tropicimonas sp. IMCC34043]
MARNSNLLDSLQNATAGNADRPKKPRSSLPAGAVGALAAGLQEMTASSIQEIDPGRIDLNGPLDRIETVTVGDDELRANIERYGQLVPVLVRPSPNDRNRFQIVYGRRRLQACAELGIAVKANVRNLDDQECVIAQGQENSARKDLSFYERCRFAKAIEAAGYDRTTIQAALNVGKSHVSEYLKIANGIPERAGNLIGAAVGIGRDRWQALLKLFADQRLTEGRAVSILEGFARKRPDATSDERFLALYAEATRRGPKDRLGAALPARELKHGAAIKDSARATTITIRRSDSGFDRWVSDNAERLIDELHDRFKAEGGAET